MRRTVHINGSLTLEFSPALVITDESIHVTLCRLSSPSYNVNDSNREVQWYNGDGTLNYKEKLYEGLYDKKSIERAIDSVLPDMRLDWENSEHSYLINEKSGTTMKIPGLDVLLGHTPGKSFTYNVWDRSENRHNLFGSRWLYVHCDIVSVTNNEPDGTVAEIPNNPILGAREFRIDSVTKIAPGTYQSMKFTILGDDKKPINPGKITLEFYIK